MFKFKISTSSNSYTAKFCTNYSLFNPFPPYTKKYLTIPKLHSISRKSTQSLETSPIEAYGHIPDSISLVLSCSCLRALGRRRNQLILGLMGRKNLHLWPNLQKKK
ncbi:hypothetical protein CDAR_425161 [Caerostris darwini]|uniref:Uncharacterized protein n=1 Tax=Caerostris darwini TaxID=1538125 RepID=A0AAV4X930_9ARAC|nr:hypothetical protein CDAR_425161 [Caerostris darwini]